MTLRGRRSEREVLEQLLGGSRGKLLIVDEAFPARRSSHPSINERFVMPTKTEYPQGTPNGFDLQTTDQSAREGAGT